MNFEKLLDSISSCDLNDNLEDQFISLYKENGLSLELVPHKYRQKGFFYEECKRIGRYDLIPQLTGDEIIALKKDYEKINNSLYRVDAKSLKLVRVDVDIHNLRAFAYQTINSYFGFSKYRRESFEKLNKQLNQLTEEEIYRIIGEEVHVFYYFKEESKDILELNSDYSKYPILFTSLEQVSFDQGGLVKLQRFGMQIYDLYSFDGESITGPCHDLDLLANGKYVERDSGNISGFHLSKYSYVSKTSEHQYSFGDFSSEYQDLLYIGNRDILEFDRHGTPFGRVENFEKPTSRSEVITILNDPSTNWITSPELVDYYKNDKELAAIAIDRDALAYTLLDYELRHDAELQKKVCYYSFCMEYNLSPEELLKFNEIQERVSEEGKLLKMLSTKYTSDKNFIMSIIPNSEENSWEELDWIKYVSKEILNDREVAIRAVSFKGTSIKWFSDSIKNDFEVATEALKKDGIALRELSNELKGNKTIVLQAVINDGIALRYASEELKNDYDVVLKAVQETGSALEYASDSLRSNYKVVQLAVENSPWSLRFASEEIQNSSEFQNLKQKNDANNDDLPF